MELTAELLRSLLHYDPETGVFTWISGPRRGCKSGTKSVKGPLVIRVDGRLFYAHRLAWLYVYGEWPVPEADHKDGDNSNNRIKNLREATRGQNAQNIRRPKSHNTSGFLGVRWAEHAKMWRVSVGINGKTKHIGYFHDATKAHEAYVLAKRELHEFCTI